jgi:hypothetical protein
VDWVGRGYRGVNGQSSLTVRDMLCRGAGEAPWVDTARRPASFSTVSGIRSGDRQVSSIGFGRIEK